MHHLKILSFSDPVIERETYCAAMVATVIDHRGTTASLTDMIDILHRAGYDSQTITAHISTVFKSAMEFQNRYVKPSN